MTQAVEAYRKAAQKLFGANEAEAKNYIRSPEDDPGEWAPDAAAIVYLEPDFRFPEDTGVIPDRLDYWGNGMENSFKLDAAAGGEFFMEYINPAVAAVWPV